MSTSGLVGFFFVFKAGNLWNDLREGSSGKR